MDCHQIAQQLVQPGFLGGLHINRVNEDLHVLLPAVPTNLHLVEQRLVSSCLLRDRLQPGKEDLSSSQVDGEHLA